MVKTNRKIVIKFIISICALWILYQAACYGYWFIRALEGPDAYSDLVKKVEELSSEQVIKKLHSFDITSPYPHIAMEVLAGRKEKKAVPHIVKFLNSWDKGKRYDAIRTLGEINDQRAIKSLMKIVKKDGDNRDYLLALEALSKMHYDEIYPIILQMEKDNFHVSWAVDMLENFPDKPETLATLKKIAKTNSENYIRDKAKKAIERIQ